MRFGGTNERNRTIEKVTVHVVAKTFGYDIVFKNFTRVRRGFFRTFKNFTVPSDQTPRIAYKQTNGKETFSVQVGCRGDPKQDLSPGLLTLFQITGGDGPVGGVASIQSCGSRKYAV